MRVFESIVNWQQYRKSIQGSLGFIPTMGNLHEGHLALCQQSIKDNAKTVVSIFINPTQFNNQSDFTHYPKTIEADIQALESIGVDYCLLPQKEMLYPDGYRYRVSENDLALSMEGACREGHFDGVLTIVLKLLNLVQAKNAYFGKKDYQQYQLVKGMAQAFFLATDIIGCETVRDEYGLALSSRNNRLNEAQLSKARAFAKVFHQVEYSVEEITKQLISKDIKVEYIQELNQRRFAAVFIGDVRLIDNYPSECRNYVYRGG